MKNPRHRHERHLTVVMRNFEWSEEIQSLNNNTEKITLGLCLENTL